LTPWFTTSYIWLLNLFGFFHTIIIIHYDVLDWHINFMPIFLFCLLIKLVCTNEISSMSSSSLLFKIDDVFLDCMQRRWNTTTQGLYIMFNYCQHCEAYFICAIFIDYWKWSLP
jgi:hypothetical protein